MLLYKTGIPIWNERAKIKACEESESIEYVNIKANEIFQRLKAPVVHQEAMNASQAKVTYQ